MIVLKYGKKKWKFLELITLKMIVLSKKAKWTKNRPLRVNAKILLYNVILKCLPCWQIAPCTIVTESKAVSDTSLSFLNCLVIRDTNMMSTVNPMNVKNVTIQTSNLNGRMHMLRTLESVGCLNIAAGLYTNQWHHRFNNTLIGLQHCAVIYYFLRAPYVSRFEIFVYNFKKKLVPNFVLISYNLYDIKANDRLVRLCTSYVPRETITAKRFEHFTYCL